MFLAKAHGIKEGQPETLVVVKSLLSRDEHHLFNFRREIDMFNKLNHENVVRLLGVCREMEPQFLITEYCEWVGYEPFKKERPVHSTPPIAKKNICEVFLRYRRLFVKGNVIIGECEIFGAEVFLHYSRFFVKGDFVTGGVECTALWSLNMSWRAHCLQLYLR